MSEERNKFVDFCIMVLANLVALAIYALASMAIWKAIW